MTPEEYAKSHKQAFRVAFDFLNTHFPPCTEPDWWDNTAKDLSDVSVASGEDDLTIQLLLGVMNYLNEEYKQRRKEHGGSDNQ